MSQRILGYSGNSYDRWVEKNSNSSTLGKVQKQFWFTKSAVIRKFGKKEDEHIVASDAELDAKILLFHAIEESTRELQTLLVDYQTRLCLLAQEENALGRLLKEFGKHDQTRAGKMMLAVGKSLSYTAQQRVHMRNPLVRLFQEVDTFQTRAVEDTLRTVEEMEKIRTEYRGALMWMKNVSQDFNPDHYQQLEKFREVQSTVKHKKSKFDQIKIKSLQKIDLLAASRCNMFSHALILYQNNLITFSEKTAKTLNTVASNFKGYHPYKFQVIKELVDPPALAECDQNDDDDDDDVIDLNDDDKTFFNAEYKDEAVNKKAKPKSSNKTHNAKSDSLLNLFDGGESERLLPENITRDGKGNKSFAPIDLLADDAELFKESSAEELLKELLDSPIHQPGMPQSLPVFGCDLTDLSLHDSDIADSAGPIPSSEIPTSQKMFMPSQLLDFDLKSWPSHYSSQTSQISPSQRIPALNTLPLRIDQVRNSSSQPDANPFFREINAATNHPAQNLVPEKKSILNPKETKKDTSKLDWYKVFQDIDPLMDPANAIFGKGADDKKC